uniref:Uncharacterized protein n=1 Tax=Solanum tuberosum TaxID=4113 RepID=M1CR73_SOLTU
MYPRGDRDVSERGEYVGHYDAEPTMLRHWQLHIELKMSSVTSKTNREDEGHVPETIHSAGRVQP